MAKHHIGVLAEDTSDCDALETIMGAVFKERDVAPGQYKIYSKSGKGCAKLRRKAAPWIQEFVDKGCRSIILVHDLDRNDERTLRFDMNAIAVPPGVRRLLCIPAEELEAWFFASPEALRVVLGDEAPKHAHPNPHLIASPKERLMRLSLGANHKPRYSATESPKLAAKLELDLCGKRCPAFRELRKFLHDLT